MSLVSHSQPSLPAPGRPDVRYARESDQKIAVPRLVRWAVATETRRQRYVRLTLSLLRPPGAEQLGPVSFVLKPGRSFSGSSSAGFAALIRRLLRHRPE